MHRNSRRHQKWISLTHKQRVNAARQTISLLENERTGIQDNALVGDSDTEDSSPRHNLVANDEHEY